MIKWKIPKYWWRKCERPRTTIQNMNMINELIAIDMMMKYCVCEYFEYIYMRNNYTEANACNYSIRKCNVKSRDHLGAKYRLHAGMREISILQLCSMCIRYSAKQLHGNCPASFENNELAIVPSREWIPSSWEQFSICEECFNIRIPTVAHILP